MALTLRERPATSALIGAIEAQLRILREELSGSRKAKSGRVHRLRVATRRLLAALELVEAVGVSVPESVRRRLRALLHRLSPLRDAQVMQRALRGLPKADIDASLMTRVRLQKRKRRKRAERRLTRFDLTELARELEDVRRCLVSADGSVRENQVASVALAGALASRHLDIERRRAVSESASEHELHELRIALKGYRYALEVLAEFLPSSADQLLAATTRLQDELGDAHDRYVLEQLVAESAGRGEASRALAEQLSLASREAHQRAAEAVKLAELLWPLSTPQLTLLGRKRSAP